MGRKRRNRSQGGGTATLSRPKRVRLSDEIGGLATGNQVRARYDAAQTTDENSKHWANADHLSALAAHSPQVRRILRIRARYEVANCPLAGSLIRKLADFVVGTGPKLQIKTRDRDYNRAVERAFQRWTIATGFARKLWQMRYAKAMNGEGVAVFMTNPPLRNPVKLDIRTIEADQLANPRLNRDQGSDGIIFDDFGNVAGYTILRRHPGDVLASGHLPDDADTWPASEVIHYFTATRPGQVRGVPEVTAALPYLSMRRRYILAVIAAAETAADFAGIIRTQQAPEDVAELEPLDVVEIERRMLMTLPAGHDIQQMRAEQPATTLEMFDGVIIREIGRCLNMPHGIAASDSSGYNFASGKLDHLPWFQSIRIEQDAIEDHVADPTFEKWYAEASRIPGYLPPPPPEAAPPPPGSPESTWWGGPPHQWFWDGQDLLDPREAGAKRTGLESGFETHVRIAARRGEDVMDEWEAQAELLGVSLDEYRQMIIRKIWAESAPATPGPGRAPGSAADEEEDDDEDQ